MIDRYSHPEIAGIWTLENKYRIWLDVEIAVCEAYHRRGIISDDEMKQIKEKADFNVQDILEIESRVHHDVIAFLTDVRDRIGPAGRWIHYGMTSSDVGDTALCMQLVQSADLLMGRLDALINVTRKLAIQYKDQAMVGRTHGIHGEPTTLGLKFAHFYAELLRNKERLESARSQVSVGKLSGAVGTFSNIDPDLEEEVCEALGLMPELVATQVVNRDRHAFFASVCGIIAGGLDRMANEIRLLQKSEGREVEEPFAKGQKGSSAMPHKRNPVVCERICGLARVVQSNVQVAYRDMPLWHERDISHSSAERVILPDICIGLDYILERMIFVLSGLHVYPENMKKTLNVTRGLIFSQRLMLTLIDAGMLRDDAYDIVQAMSMRVWGDDSLDLKTACLENADVTSRLSQEQIEVAFKLDHFLRNVDAIYRRLGLT
jgi:adenylosuccinate lyase